MRLLGLLLLDKIVRTDCMAGRKSKGLSIDQTAIRRFEARVDVDVEATRTVHHILRVLLMYS